MASRASSQCPNCAATYTPRALFCTACGRARDTQPPAETVTERLDPNRSIMLEPGRPRRRASAAPQSPALAPVGTKAALPKPSAAVVIGVMALFFGLVWTGRRLNGPKPPPPRPPAAPSVVTSVFTPTPEEQRRFEAKARRDLQEAQSYSESLRAEAAAQVLQGHLRNAQAPPTSDPKPYTTIRVHPVNKAGN